MKMVRIYLSESKHLLDKVLHFLHEKHRVRGATVFRGIAGFGEKGKVHESKLLTLSLELPIVIEFYDSKEKIQALKEPLSEMIEKGHMISWDVEQFSS